MIKLKRILTVLMAATFFCATVVTPCSAEEDPTLTRAEFLQRLYEVYLEHGGATIAEECEAHYDSNIVAPGGFGTCFFFDDVDFYYDGSRMLYELTGWASSAYRKITNGAAMGEYLPLFFPNREITYREAIVMIYRLVMSADMQPEWRADISPDDVPAWVADAAIWWLSNVEDAVPNWKDAVTADAADNLFKKVFQSHIIKF